MSPLSAKEATLRLEALSSPSDAAFLQGFFKTGKGQYGEGDLFRGIRVPALRSLAKELKGAPLSELETLLRSKWHEDRVLALIALTMAFEKGDEPLRKRIFELYVARIKAHINNWDLVDISAPNIVGAWLLDKDRSLLDKLAKSASLWERRVAMVSTLAFIRRGELSDAFRVAEALLGDKRDLTHKATGWMLREAGKRDVSALESFLKLHGAAMPRTALRYAIERFPEAKRKAFLKLGKA